MQGAAGRGRRPTCAAPGGGVVASAAPLVGKVRSRSAGPTSSSAKRLASSGPEKWRRRLAVLSVTILAPGSCSAANALTRSVPPVLAGLLDDDRDPLASGRAHGGVAYSGRALRHSSSALKVHASSSSAAAPGASSSGIVTTGSTRRRPHQRELEQVLRPTRASPQQFSQRVPPNRSDRGVGTVGEQRPAPACVRNA